MPSHYGNSGGNSPKKPMMSMEDRLKEHAKQHKGGMRSKHMKNMKKFIKEGDSFEKAHRKAMAEDKKDEGVFSATEGKIKHGALRKALKVKGDEKLKRAELSRALKTKTGDMFEYNKNKFKMTEMMRKRIQLAVNMMKK